MVVSGYRLMELYERKGFKRTSFAKALGVSETTIRRWEQGTNIKKKYLDKICEVLEIVPADLKVNEVIAVGNGERKIPVIQLPGSIGEVIRYMYYDLKDVSMIVVADSSMEPEIENGAHVFITETSKPMNGKIMLVEVNGKLYLRECRKTKNGYIYIPLNTDKEQFEECKVIGQAKAKTTSL